jgi:cytochrome P450 / NADPH-cytochrome P450 reductase
MATLSTPIPGPPAKLFIGNILDIDPNEPLKSFQRLQKEYGEIFQFSVVGQRKVAVSSHRLIDEVCDERRFRKIPNNVMNELRNGVHDSLFTAHPDELNWSIAHRVLMPAFGPRAIQSMFDEMHDITSQLVLKWARQGPRTKVLATDDFTRLALDTIALCSMGFRFNSFYDEKLHPFINSMGDFLSECSRRSQRLPIPEWFYRSANQKYQNDIDIMRETAETVLKERIANPNNKRADLLTRMLKARDPKTGKKMSDVSIVDNLLTFLIAGHETTSGMLSYAVVSLDPFTDKNSKFAKS